MNVVAVLMGAGFETTSGFIGSSLVALARNPEQRDLIRTKPDLWPNAVEELLRYDTPVKVLGRQATADIDIGGSTIPAGSNIVVSLMAGHRDTRRYERPHDLILDRDDPRPLSFGHGIHHCVGAALARLESEIGLRSVLDRYGDYEIVDGGLEWRHSMVLRNQDRLLLNAA